MSKPKLVRITTIPISLEKLLEGQLAFMNDYFEVIAISSDGQSLGKFARKEKVRSYMVSLTRKITPIKDLLAVYRLYRFLRVEKPKIVHSHTPKAGVVGMIAAKLAGVPHRLHTVAGLPLMETVGVKRKILIAVERLTYRCSTMIYPNSSGLIEFILKENLCSHKKMKILANGSSNGIDTDFFDRTHFTESDTLNLKKKLGIDKDAFIFVFVGRLVGDKGINELIAAYQRVSQKHHVALVLVGTQEQELDPLNKETLDIISKDSTIYETGFQTDVRGYFACAKALVFPSYREGFPNVVLQAGAMSLPSIVSDINGCNEIITENVNGKLVPPKDVKALQKAMEDMILNVDNYKNMQESARKTITDSYKRNVIWKALLSEYKQLLELS